MIPWPRRQRGCGARDTLAAPAAGVDYGYGVRIAITGSLANDHLMTFPGRFSDSFVAEKLDQVSLSFLADDLQVRRGGVAGNIAFGMAVLGLRPVLVAAAGVDFADYRSWLERHGVDCSAVRVSTRRHTARFTCTTDTESAQIATFYPGAMSEAREIELGPVAGRLGRLDLVLIGPNDPQAMLRHTDECRDRGIPFAADPSQQLASMSGAEIRRLIDGARYLFTNEYEARLAEQKTGWSAGEISERVTTRITTQGKDGAVVTSNGSAPIRVGVVPARRVADPTGVGDAFRAGFLAGLSWGLPHERCAQVGCLLATHVVESVGTQEYEDELGGAASRLAETYGQEAAAEIGAHLPAFG